MFVFLWLRENEAGSKLLSGDQLRESIQKWLSPPDPSLNHNNQCGAHHNGTTTWFLEGPVYNKWKATGTLLWTHGNRMGFHSFPSHSTDGLRFRSGIWQEHSLVGDISTLC
jgi:hypothetical protein